MISDVSLHYIARTYREEELEFFKVSKDPGFVIIYQGKPVGWMHSGGISEPNGWLEGCYAVPQNAIDQIYRATGGTYMKGADQWEPKPKS